MASRQFGAKPLSKTMFVHFNTLSPRQMGADNKATSSDAFSWMKISKFRLRFHWCLFPMDNTHDDVIKWKHFPRYWSFVRGIHPKASDAKLWYFLWSAWNNTWANNGEAGDLRRHRAHYDVIWKTVCDKLFRRMRRLWKIPQKSSISYFILQFMIFW